MIILRKYYLLRTRRNCFTGLWARAFDTATMNGSRDKAVSWRKKKKCEKVLTLQYSNINNKSRIITDSNNINNNTDLKEIWNAGSPVLLARPSITTRHSDVKLDGTYEIKTCIRLHMNLLRRFLGGCSKRSNSWTLWLLYWEKLYASSDQMCTTSVLQLCRHKIKRY
jgi:hypothetical protein